MHEEIRKRIEAWELEARKRLRGQWWPVEETCFECDMPKRVPVAELVTLARRPLAPRSDGREREDGVVMSVRYEGLAPMQIRYGLAAEWDPARGEWVYPLWQRPAESLGELLARAAAEWRKYEAMQAVQHEETAKDDGVETVLRELVEVLKQGFEPLV